MKKQMGKIRIAIQLGAGALLVVGGLGNLPVTFLIILVATVLLGPIFCGWICPFGTLQDLVSQLSRGVKKHKMPKGIQKWLVVSRYLLMAVTTLLTVDFVFTLMQYDARINLISVMQGKVLTIGAYVVLALYLITAVFFERPFCNYMCPQGAKYGLMSTLRPFRIVRDLKTCVKCGKCDKACPMNIDIMGKNNVKSLQCINCMSCVAACPKQGALKYGIIKLDRKSAVAYFVAVGLIVATSTVAMALQFTANQSSLESEKAQALTTLQTQNTQLQAIVETPVATNTEKAVTSTPQTSNKATQTTSKTTQAPVATKSTAAIVTKTPTASTATTATTASTASTAPVAAKPISSPVATTTTTTTTAPAETTQPKVSTKAGAAAGIADGTYQGEANGFRGPMTVAVAVKNEQIISVEVVNHSDDRKWFNRAVSMVPNWIIEAQSTNVDTVSGATYSSLGIIDAAKNALDRAK